MKRNFKSKSVKTILDNMISGSNSLNSGLNNVKVQKIWEQTMGSNVNSYTKEVNLKNKTLYISLSSSVLRQELLYGRAKIIENLNDHLGREMIEKLVLR